MPALHPVLYELKAPNGDQVIYEPQAKSLCYGQNCYNATTLQAPPLGTLVTASLLTRPPFSFVIRTLTLVVPDVNPGNMPSQPINNTFAVFTTELIFSPPGQIQSYTVVIPLNGTVYFVDP